MTRRQLAKRLSDDIMRRGVHYVNGTSVFMSITGEWSGFPGVHPPPQDTSFYEVVGWDQVVERNTPDRIDKELFRIERRYKGYPKNLTRRGAKYVDIRNKQC